jgi:hypothetical protein
MHKANLKGMNPVRAGRSVFARREEESAQKTQYQILVSFILKTPVIIIIQGFSVKLSPKIQLEFEKFIVSYLLKLSSPLESRHQCF